MGKITFLAKITIRKISILIMEKLPNMAITLPNVVNGGRWVLYPPDYSK
jgi:hypothetical protein